MPEELAHTIRSQSSYFGRMVVCDSISKELSADASSTMTSPYFESPIHRESIKVHAPSNLAVIVLLDSSITELPDGGQRR
ncbi:hypothetical protein JMJ77_0005186 [Colletotrichum scovillei]|uniref:Uncharacterized protein n=1 Tax=Colletotrichum scovillei TaxID=1209932 RepID=A0A9P7UH91_9PEZI|nr:hypothetical protein JMJ77_0005186 [Colletotrichum scovillei]KAG7076401.1 hypothetical protein JMJ76_0013666 [Colletotrichum scovillei]KAG7083565.1 hypothetical protein JMJ78_0009010 [Colletotrichum scovillei]